MVLLICIYFIFFCRFTKKLNIMTSCFYFSYNLACMKIECTSNKTLKIIKTFYRFLLLVNIKSIDISKKIKLYSVTINI